MAHYIHHVPGRLRIRLPQLKRNPAYAAALERGLQDLPGVVSAQSNLVTGSLLVCYEPRKLSAADLQRAIPEVQLEQPVCPTCSVPRVGAAVGLGGSFDTAGGGVGEALLNMAMEKVMERSARALLGVLF